MLTLAALLFSSAHAETSEEPRRQFYVGSSLFMLFNLLPNPPSFFQLNLGWRPTVRDSVSLEAITRTIEEQLAAKGAAPFGNEA